MSGNLNAYYVALAAKHKGLKLGDGSGAHGGMYPRPPQIFLGDDFAQSGNDLYNKLLPIVETLGVKQAAKILRENREFVPEIAIQEVYQMLPDLQKEVELQDRQAAQNPPANNGGNGSTGTVPTTGTKQMPGSSGMAFWENWTPDQKRLAMYGGGALVLIIGLAMATKKK